MARVEAGQDPTVGSSETRDRIELPCEKRKFGGGSILPWPGLDMGSVAGHGFGQVLPALDTLRKVYLDAAMNGGEADGGLDQRGSPRRCGRRRRLGGRRWWDPDWENHLSNLPVSVRAAPGR